MCLKWKGQCERCVVHPCPWSSRPDFPVAAVLFFCPLPRVHPADRLTASPGSKAASAAGWLSPAGVLQYIRSPSVFIQWQLIMNVYLLSLISNTEWLEYLFKTEWSILFALKFNYVDFSY